MNETGVNAAAVPVSPGPRHVAHRAARPQATLADIAAGNGPKRSAPANGTATERRSPVAAAPATPPRAIFIRD
jgi:hypothetical protein